jgi:hypothetical protein
MIFEHHWGDSIVQFDGTTQYVNTAGNILTFEKAYPIQYFISNLKFNTVFIPGANNLNVHYISSDSAYSTLLLTYRIPERRYNTISFTFGVDSTKNKSNLFPNPPQRNMFWPDPMGGGYHHMKMDGRWRNAGGTATQGFELHLGDLKKTVYDTTWIGGSIAKIDTLERTFRNSFPVEISKHFEIRENEITTVTVIMDMKQWMENPYMWNFNVMGGAIMSRENAMDSLKRNGEHNLFRAK